jgi:hypothetical protein
MILTQDQQQQRREKEIGDRAKRLGRWLARLAFEEGQSIDELKGQLPPLLLVIEQTAIQYFNEATAEAQAAAKTEGAPSSLMSRGDVFPDLDVRKLLFCSFCGKGQHEVKKLIAGPKVFICDACLDLCMDIVRKERETEAQNDNRDDTS